MFLNKLWFILVTLVAAVALTVAFVAPRSAGRQLAQTEALGLDRAQYAAEQMLKTDARRWIDYVAKLGRDARLTEALDGASRGGAEERVLHESVRGRLGALVVDPASIGIQTLGALDASGKVIARIGENENDYGESFRGLDVIADALAGYLSDSVWARGGRMLRVAAAPVLSRARDRIVGAVFVAVENGDRLAEIWKRNLGVDVVFLLGGQVTSATLPAAALGGLAARVEERADEIASMRRTRAFTVPLGNDEYSAVAAPFAGEAEVMGGYYVLLQQRRANEDPLALLSSTTRADLAWEVFPWLKLGGAVLGLLVVGLFLQHREVEAPLARLREQLQKLARGELQKLDDRQHPGRFGGIARDVNASLERAAGHAHGVGPTTGDRRDLNKLLGEDGRERASSLPPLPPLGGPGAAWGGGTPVSAAPMGLQGLPQPGFGLSAAGQGFGAAPASAPGFAPAPPSGSGFAPAPPSGPSSFQTGGAPGSGPTPGFAPVPSPPAYAPPPAPPAMPPPPPAAASAALGAVPGASLASPPLPGGPGRQPAPPPLARSAPGAPPAAEMEDQPTKDMARDQSGAVDEWEAHVRAVFAEYVATRARCGEPTQGLLLDKFREKLEANRKAIVEKYHCTSARFAVYVKDGKTALKASPSR